MTRPPRQTDLFGAPLQGDRDRTPVEIRMVVVDQTDAGIFLAIDGRKGSARWAPKSEVKAGEGTNANLFRMAKWVARERGWL
ncbi:hypothetical protein [Phenylobacterium sp.]|uniref:hypothetical protein n=1 Tax=Phenylobacterium sp. TaxID=1871053 RepID=UPI002735C18D|nr:hypothetical protein [Phenylobacterium sp.]MDP3853634.1 hypothetical protein [Phenylobacterium sp.]